MSERLEIGVEPLASELEAIELATELSRQQTCDLIAGYVVDLMQGRHLYSNHDMNCILNCCLDLRGDTYKMEAQDE